MPYKPKKPCRYPGCPNLAGQSYCDRHARQRNQEYNRHIRDPEMQAFYDSPAWRACSKRQLRTQPLCEMCRREGRLTKAQLADHIRPIKQGGARLDPENLQSLCWACHNRKTAKE